MLFVIIGKWKAENTDEVIDRLVNRKVPLPEEFKAIEYYQLLGKHMAVRARFLELIEIFGSVDVAYANIARTLASTSLMAEPAFTWAVNSGIP
jgi:hypothetical protein